MAEIDPEVREAAERFVAKSGNKRAVTAVRIMLEQGSVTTGDLNAAGYDHPPRAIGDVKDNGIPVVKVNIRKSDGKLMASYSLGSAADLRAAQQGRANFSKKFRKAMLDRYGAVDNVTGAHRDAKLLQIDHRIPYRVAGDIGAADVEAYMLLEATTQRSKSWSCENCENFKKLLDPTICQGCFWAFPEAYLHVAMMEVRRTDIVWQGDDVALHDALKMVADEEGKSVSALVIDLLRVASQKASAR
jgi:hypothetical protein